MNQVNLVGNIKGRVATGTHAEYGQWAIFTLDISEKVVDTWYHQYIPCIASKKVAETISMAEEGDKVIIAGKIKSKEKDGVTKINVDVKEFAILEKAKPVEVEEDKDVKDLLGDIDPEV